MYETQRFIFSCSRGKPWGKYGDNWISQMVTWQLVLSAPFQLPCKLLFVCRRWTVFTCEGLCGIMSWLHRASSFTSKPPLHDLAACHSKGGCVEDGILKLGTQDLIQKKEDYQFTHQLQVARNSPQEISEASWTGSDFSNWGQVPDFTLSLPVSSELNIFFCTWHWGPCSYSFSARTFSSGHSTGSSGLNPHW